MSTTNEKANLIKIVGAFAKVQEQPISSGIYHLAIETIQSAEQTNTIVTGNCESASEDADAEMSWLAKAFDPTVPKVEDWEEDWDTDSEAEFVAASKIDGFPKPIHASRKTC